MSRKINFSLHFLFLQFTPYLAVRGNSSTVPFQAIILTQSSVPCPTHPPLWSRPGSGAQREGLAAAPSLSQQSRQQAGPTRGALCPREERAAHPPSLPLTDCFFLRRFRQFASSKDFTQDINAIPS